MKSLQIFLTLMVFFVACCVGLSIARQKPLWGDEVFSEQNHVAPYGYWAIITGRIPNEGEKAPVYFCFQKFIDNVFLYKFPENFIFKPPYLYVDSKAQVVCRINSVVWMSLSIALIFYFFTRYVALWAGLSALLITLSTYMVWGYWAEDRLYASWFFWTSIQALAVAWSSQDTHQRSKVLTVLALTNVLLSLTTAFSIVQIAALSIWMFLVGYRKISDYIWTTLIPFLICLYYCNHTNLYLSVFTISIWKIITANIAPERIVVVTMAALYFWRRTFQPPAAQDSKNDLGCLSYYVLEFAVGFGFLYLLFKMKTAPAGSIPGGLFVAVESRYFLFLAPIGLVASTFVFVRLMQISRSWKAKIALVLLLVVLTVPRIWRYAHLSYTTGGPKYLEQVTDDGIFPHLKALIRHH